jgi:transcription initiation factor IIE alpha subunit
MAKKNPKKQKPRRNRYVCTRCSAQFTLKERVLNRGKCPICGNKKILREDKLVKEQQARNVKVGRMEPVAGLDKSEWNLPSDTTRTRRGLDAK